MGNYLMEKYCKFQAQRHNKHKKIGLHFCKPTLFDDLPKQIGFNLQSK